MFQNYLVSYTEDIDGVATTENQVFETLDEATAYFNKVVDEGSEDVFLCQILSTN